MATPLERLRSSLAGRYRIEDELGAGGSATVYLAEDLKHHRRVAIKVLRPELAAMVGPERFLREIEVTARLQHPHILQLYDSGEVDGVPWYVTPFVEGESLRDRIERDAPLPVPEAVEIVRAVAAALQYAHERGVVHRDVKPENVLLQAGQPVVADFGVALALSEARAERMTAVGTSLGTPGYMAPEQVAGEEDVGVPADIYALGVLLYEMLVGEPPFVGGSLPSLFARMVSERPVPVRARRQEVPGPVSEAVDRALEKEPGARFPSAGAFAEALRAAPGGSPAPASRGRRIAIAATALVVVALGGWVAVREVEARAERTWARTEAIPQVQSLLGEWESVRAYQLASRALEILPDDPTLRSLVEAASRESAITSDPAGALVRYRAYDPDAPDWASLGSTPVRARLPDQQLVVRFEKAGHRPLEIVTIPAATASLHARLVPDSADDLVFVPAGQYGMGVEPVAVDSFWIDRLEVTRREYQRFVEAGGYEDPDWWPTLGDGERSLPFGDAMARLVDATGRAGPAGWELGRPEAGSEDLPVGGLSWFEAVAYCRWAGKELPTFYHWKLAAGVDVWDNILAFSNFGARGPEPAGASGGVGFNGTVDMAGNVREWVWNETRGLRYVLGGAWDSPQYMFLDRDAVDPWNRDPRNGLRCARYAVRPGPGLTGPAEETFFDFTGFEAVDDETYAFYASLFEYDPAPLDARSLSADTTAEWILQRVEFAAAYDGRRIPAHVFLPRNAEPPFQTVVYFPGSAARVTSSLENAGEVARLMFLPRSGRALVFPVLRGMYERRDEAPSSPGPAAIRQHYVRVVQDVMRTVDYVVERDDLDQDALAYMGVSLGAELASPVALEKRFDALVLVGGALDPVWRGAVPDEVAPWNHATRITTPTLLVNGERDYMHPYRESQIPYFEAIDVPEEDKRFVVLEAGHVPDWNDVIRHTLDWLDERLGQVTRRPAS